MKRVRTLRLLSLGTTVALAAVACWSVAIEPNLLTTHAITIDTPGFPSIRVAAISDIHAGGFFVDLPKIEALVARTNAENPDLVVLLGDFVHTNRRDALANHRAARAAIEPEDFAPRLANLRAPLGVYAVLGNHDWWYDGPRVRAALVAAGIRVLENTAEPLVHHDQRFWLLGLEDEYTRTPDAAPALRMIPSDEPILALAHNPDIFESLSPRIGVLFAGHTHGGQVALPWLGRLAVPSRFEQRYAAGHVEERGRHLFVTTGVGTSIVPVRFRVPPEVAIITLGPAGLPAHI